MANKKAGKTSSPNVTSFVLGAVFGAESFPVSMWLCVAFVRQQWSALSSEQLLGVELQGHFFYEAHSSPSTYIVLYLVQNSYAVPFVFSVHIVVYLVQIDSVPKNIYLNEEK